MVNQVIDKIKKEENVIETFVEEKKKQQLNKPKKNNYFAIIFNKNEFKEIVSIDISQKKFRYGNKSYYINFENVLIFSIKGYFSNKKYILYELHNIEPLMIEDKNVIPKRLNAVEFDAILENKVIDDVMSHTGSFDIEKFVKDNIVYIGIGVAVLIFFVFSGGL